MTVSLHNINTDTSPDVWQRIGQFALLAIEGIVLLLIIYAFWHNITERALWFWMLWLAVPIFAVRLRLFGYLWTHIRLHDLMIIFIIVAAFNYLHAPLARESFMAAFGRPLLGMWLCIYLIELTRTARSAIPALLITLGMAFTLSLIALTTSQWLPGKSDALWFIIEWLPQFDYRTAATQLAGEVCSPVVDWVWRRDCFNPAALLSSSGLSFNVNEIAGALALMTPFAGALALCLPIKKEAVSSDSINIGLVALRVVAAIIFGMLFLALLLGQSRFAIAGVLGSLLIVAGFGLRGTPRYIALGVVTFFIVLQAAILFNWGPFATLPANTTSTEVGITARDSQTFLNRFAIWESAGKMVRDYPMTGVGMYMFRSAVSNPGFPYEIPYYVENDLFPPPHAHNAWFNMGAEMGLLGAAVYIALQIIIVWMLWLSWRDGNSIIRAIALATFAGLLGYAAYSVGDTVALWDRFQFVQWWLVGMAGAVYTLTSIQSDEDENTDNKIVSYES